MAQLAFLPEDLSPGDRRRVPLDPSELTLCPIHGVDQPEFEVAYGLLWTEFGALHEMESREVIRDRLSWRPVRAVDGRWFRYELVLVQRGNQPIAVRDHVAIVAPDSNSVRCVVHLSHVWVDPAWRRTGLAAWLRALPLQTARQALVSSGHSTESPITLVAEMEHPDNSVEARQIRLNAYEKAGFLKLDPAVVPYHQPDFRPPADIDASGGPQPLPFGLIVRRVGREHETQLARGEALQLVDCLYRMYGLGFRARDMAPLWDRQKEWAKGEGFVGLLPPSASTNPTDFS